MLSLLLIIINVCCFGFLLIPANLNPIRSEAVDYDEPVQYRTERFVNNFRGNAQGDWRQSSFTRDIPADALRSSFRISAYAVDNYGTPFEVWCSVYQDSDLSQVVYNHGWSTTPIINEPLVFISSNVSTITIVYRFRYTTGTGTNPPNSTDFPAIRLEIDYDVPVNYSQPQTTAIPQDWLATTTETVTVPDFDFATSTKYDMNNFDTFTESVKYNVATIFGIADSGADITRVMNYIDSKTQYASAIISFCLLCGCVVECMKWG